MNDPRAALPNDSTMPGATAPASKEPRSMDAHLPKPLYPRFHLAFPVTDLAEARRFYGEFLGCAEGRSSDDWVDFDFYGHQIVAHKVAALEMADAMSLVDGQRVPVRHFGVILELPAWEALATKLRAAGTRFVIEPYVRFKGLAGEQATMFFLDPFGNALEFKAFADMRQLFAR
jgi:extradiol dioxygenase family protein